MVVGVGDDGERDEESDPRVDDGVEPPVAVQFELTMQTVRVEHMAGEAEELVVGDVEQTHQNPGEPHCQEGALQGEQPPVVCRSAHQDVPGATTGNG